jgi:hypothetical protein
VRPVRDPPGADHVTGLPEAEDRAGRVHGDRHPAGRADVHRRDQQLPAVLGDRDGGRVDVVRGEVDGPRGVLTWLQASQPATACPSTRAIR